MANSCKRAEKPAEETAEGAEAAAEGEAPKEWSSQLQQMMLKPEVDKDKKEAAPEKNNLLYNLKYNL